MKLTQLQRTYGGEYHALSPSEKATLVSAYENDMDSRTRGYRVSSKSRVQDFTKTIDKIETMVSDTIHRKTLQLTSDLA